MRPALHGSARQRANAGETEVWFYSGRNDVVVSLAFPFDFEGGEKAFRHCVVPAIAFTAHAALDAVYRQQLLIVMAGVLAAAIRVMQQTLRRLTVSQCHLKGG